MKTKTHIHASRPAAPALRVLVICGALGLLAGCATQPESHVLSAPPPAPPRPTVDNPAPSSTTTTTTTTAPAVTPVAGATQSTTIVTQAPPPPRQEVAVARPAQPGPDFVWIDGYWTWRNARYEWMPGHWERPPASTAAWVSPHWEQEGSGYRFYEGYWKY